MSQVTIAQAIRNAIEVEKAAERFYNRMAGNTRDVEVQAFFEGMAAQERDHARSFEEMAKRLDAGELPTRADSKVSGIETAPGWDCAEDVSMEEALSLAVEAENSAQLYYDALADHSTGELKEFFANMARVEETHAEEIRRMQQALLG